MYKRIFSNLKKRNLKQLFFMYCCALFFIVFLTPNRYEGTYYTPKLIPVYYTLQRLHIPPGAHFWRYYFYYWGNIFGNIILFAPFSFLIKLITPQGNSLLILLYGILASISVEVLQYILQIGVCDIDDVLLNAAGLLAGLYALRYCRIIKNKQSYL